MEHTVSSNTWFTGDTHFGHKNILAHAARPFGSIEEMDETIIANWNAKVDSKDDVYHLGDAGLCSPSRLKEILRRLNGNIYLIKGNHEKTADACADRFVWIKDYFELEVADNSAYRGQRLLVLFHYALRVWNASHYGSYHLYGHSHGQLPDDPQSLSFDAGVDCHRFTPISYNEVVSIMSRKQWVKQDLR